MENEKIIDEIAEIIHSGCDGTYCRDCKFFTKELKESGKCIAMFTAERLYNADCRKQSDVVAEVVAEIKNFITSEIAKREYHTEIEIKTQAKILNRVWAMLDKIEKKYKGE